MNNETAIAVKGVSKKFKIYFDKGNQLKEKMIFWKRNRHEDRWVLKDVSFEIKKGEAVALVGHNGCGKSTMLKLLTKIIYPNSGTIETQGRISCLIELGAGFHPDMTGRENIYINASIFGLSKKEIDRRIDEIIAFSELEEFMDNPVRTYSSGMYMRLAFAVAINVDADILLIDEILAVGDANFQAKCFKRLEEFKASGKTIVLVTHDTGTVKEFCDRAIWINDGEVAATGEAEPVVDQYLDFMDEKKAVPEISAEVVAEDEDPLFRLEPELTYANGALKGHIHVTNLAERLEVVSGGTNPLNLGISMVDEDQQILNMDVIHLPIRRFGPMEKGETIAVPVSLTKLQECAEKGYGFRFAIVHEGIAWLNNTAAYYQLEDK